MKRRYDFIGAEKERHPVSVTCRVAQVSRTAYYNARKKTPSLHSQQDHRLSALLRANHKAKRKICGVRGHVAELASQGVRCSPRRVRRLMKENDLVSCHPRPFVVTTLRGVATKLPDLVNRVFFAPRRDLTWVGDITYIPTDEGWVFLALLTDLFSRRPVGWAVADHLRTPLPLQALEMAWRQRKPGPGLTHHGDLGTQYTSHDYAKALSRHRMVQSAGDTGVCWDNALAESVNGSFKKELLHRQTWRNADHVRREVAGYMRFYIQERRHSSLGYLTPQEFEDAHAMFGADPGPSGTSTRNPPTPTVAPYRALDPSRTAWDA